MHFLENLLNLELLFEPLLLNKRLVDNVCVVEPASDGGDSAPAILNAFGQCGQGGTVRFQNATYNVNSVMNTTGLKDCNIENEGTLLVHG